MIPLRDENPTRTTPVVVIILIIVNVLVFLADALAGAGNRAGLVQFTMVPANVINEVMGRPPVVVPTLQPAWLTIFSSMFMHANFLHIAGNMLYLWVFGNNIEDRLGHFRFVLFYLAGGVAAALAHIASASVAANPGAALVPTVGASGAIAAVLGAYLILFPGARVICLIVLGIFFTTAAVPALIVLGWWFLIQIVSVGAIGGTGAGGGVAYYAHVGGFVAGIVLIYILGGRRLLGGSRDYPYRPYGYD